MEGIQQGSVELGHSSPSPEHQLTTVLRPLQNFGVPIKSMVALVTQGSGLDAGGGAGGGRDDLTSQGCPTAFRLTPSEPSSWS